MPSHGSDDEECFPKKRYPKEFDDEMRGSFMPKKADLLKRPTPVEELTPFYPIDVEVLTKQQSGQKRKSNSDKPKARQ